MLLQIKKQKNLALIKVQKNIKWVNAKMKFTFLFSMLFGIILLSLSGCVVQNIKERTGEKIVDVMETGRLEFCNGTFPLKSYEQFLKNNNKTWKELDSWCNRQYGISSEYREEEGDVDSGGIENSAE